MNKIKIFDNLVMFIVAIYISGFLNFLSVTVFKQDSYLLSSVVVGIILLFYMFKNLSCIRLLLSFHFFNFAFFTIAIYPLISFAYSPSPILSEFLRQIMHSVLMLYIIILICKGDRDILARLCLWALIITIIGGGISVYVPAVFDEFVLNKLTRSIGQFSSIAADGYRMGGRAYGFHLQPNQFALTICVTLCGVLYFYDNKKSLLKYLLISISIFMTVLSGSRFGFLGIFVVVVLFLFHDFIGIRSRMKMEQSNIPRFFILVCFSILAIVSIYFFKSLLFQDESVLVNAGYTTPLERIKAFVSASDVESDSSLIGRIEARMFYIKLAFSNGITFLLGSGHGFTSYYVLTGNYEIYSHCFFVNSLVEYGIVYVLFFFSIFVIAYFNKKITNLDRENIFTIFVLFMVFALSGVLFSAPNLPLLLGMYFGCVLCGNINRC